MIKRDYYTKYIITKIGKHAYMFHIQHQNEWKNESNWEMMFENHVITGFKFSS